VCLQVFAVPTVTNRVSADRLSAVSGLRIEKRRGEFHISVDGGCSCSLLSDSADWNAETWALEPKVLDGLSRVLRLLSDEAGGFAFQALWIGDKPKTRSESSLRELLSDVQQNCVRNKHVYLVGEPAG
jgi:hypothetical protein